MGMAVSDLWYDLVITCLYELLKHWSEFMECMNVTCF